MVFARLRRLGPSPRPSRRRDADRFGGADRWSLRHRVEKVATVSQTRSQSVGPEGGPAFRVLVLALEDQVRCFDSRIAMNWLPWTLAFSRSSSVITTVFTRGSPCGRRRRTGFTPKRAPRELFCRAG